MGCNICGEEWESLGGCSGATCAGRCEPVQRKEECTLPKGFDRPNTEGVALAEKNTERIVPENSDTGKKGAVPESEDTGKRKTSKSGMVQREILPDGNVGDK